MRSSTNDEKQQMAYLQRSRQDLLARSAPGALLFPGAALLIVLSYELYHIIPFRSLAFVGLLTLISLIRYGLKKANRRQLPVTSSQWIYIFHFCIVCQVMLWSVAFGHSLMEPRLAPIFPAMVLASCAMSAAALNSLTPSRWLAEFTIIFVLLPTMLLMLFHTERWQLAILMVWYVVYLLIMSTRIRKEYFAFLAAEMRLVEQQQALKELNNTDHLTQISNRRFFERRLKYAWELAKRSLNSIAVVTLDIDHFKDINDSYGHPAGDRCLIVVAAILKKISKRSTDVVARVGGEEFAILLANTELKAAIAIAENMRYEIEHTAIDGLPLKVTASFGVHAQTPSQGASRDSMLKAVDKALYHAKQNGRNQVCSYAESLIDDQ